MQNAPIKDEECLTVQTQLGTTQKVTRRFLGLLLLGDSVCGLGVWSSRLAQVQKIHPESRASEKNAYLRKMSAMASAWGELHELQEGDVVVMVNGHKHPGAISRLIAENPDDMIFMLVHRYTQQTDASMQTQVGYWRAGLVEVAADIGELINQFNCFCCGCLTGLAPITSFTSFQVKSHEAIVQTQTDPVADGEHDGNWVEHDGNWVEWRKMNPLDLRFSQESCSSIFTSGEHSGEPLTNLVNDLKSGRVHPHNGRLWLRAYEARDSTGKPVVKCIDNRRLWALKEYSKSQPFPVSIWVRMIPDGAQVARNSDKHLDGSLVDGLEIRLRPVRSHSAPPRSNTAEEHPSAGRSIFPPSRSSGTGIV